jgi:hypothetical protein
MAQDNSSKDSAKTPTKKAKPRRSARDLQFIKRSANIGKAKRPVPRRGDSAIPHSEDCKHYTAPGDGRQATEKAPVPAAKPSAPNIKDAKTARAPSAGNRKTDQAASTQWRSTCKDKSKDPVQKSTQGRRAPKFVTASDKVNVDKYWHGEMIECFWEIKNEGDAPLKIRAKGG